ncbi:hypothetical protein YC2023_043892 [Brassica napus]
MMFRGNWRKKMMIKLNRGSEFAKTQYSDTVAEFAEEVKRSDTGTSIGDRVKNEQKTERRKYQEEALFAAEMIKDEKAAKNKNQEVDDTEGKLEEEDDAQQEEDDVQ